MWEFYLAYCEAGFAHRLPRRRPGPLRAGGRRCRGLRDDSGDDVDPVVPARPAPERPPGAARGHRRRLPRAARLRPRPPAARDRHPAHPAAARLGRVAVEGHPGALVIRRGNPVDVIPALAQEVGAQQVHVSRETTPYGRRRDEAVEKALADDGRELVATGTPYAVGPGRIVNQSGSPYKVFTPFSKAWHQHGRPAPAERAQAHPVAARGRAQRPPARGARRPGSRPARPPRSSGGSASSDERAHGIRQGTRPTRPRHDAPAVGAAQVRRDPPAHDARRHRGALGRAVAGREHLRHRAGLARVLRRRAVAPARLGVARPAARARADALRRARADRSSTRGARAAPATRSSTPGCASCSRRAGCTTGSG